MDFEEYQKDLNLEYPSDNFGEVRDADSLSAAEREALGVDSIEDSSGFGESLDPSKDEFDQRLEAEPDIGEISPDTDAISEEDDSVL